MAKFILAEALKSRGITKYHFAKLLKVQYFSVFRYFRKGYDPKLSTLTRFAKALKCKVSDLIQESK